MTSQLLPMKRTNRFRKGPKISAAREFAEANPLDRLLALGIFSSRIAACREFTNPQSRHFKQELRKVKAQQLARAYDSIARKSSLEDSRAAVEAGEDDQHHRDRIAKQKEWNDRSSRRIKEAAAACAAIKAGEPVTDADKENGERHQAHLDRRKKKKMDRCKRVKLNPSSATAHEIAVVNKQTADETAWSLKRTMKRRGKRREINDKRLHLLRQLRGHPRKKEIFVSSAHEDGHSSVADGGPIVHGSGIAPWNLLGSSGAQAADKVRFCGQTCAPGSVLWTSFPEGYWSNGTFVWAAAGGIVPSKEAELSDTLIEMFNSGDCDKASAAMAALVHLQTKHRLDVTDSSNPPLYLYCFLREVGSPYRDFFQHKINGALVGGNANFFMKHYGPAPVGPNTPGLVVMKVDCGPRPRLSEVIAIDPTKSSWTNNVVGIHDGVDGVVDLTEDEYVDVDI